MAEHVMAPACIEGSEILVTGQLIDPTAKPKLLRGTADTMVFPITIKKQGRGKITREHARNKKNQLVAVYDGSSHLEKDETIIGTNLWGFSGDPIVKVNKGGAGRTSSHTGQFVELENGAYLRLVQGVIGLPYSPHPKIGLLA